MNSLFSLFSVLILEYTGAFLNGGFTVRRTTDWTHSARTESVLFSTSSTDNNEELKNEIKSMRVREIMEVLKGAGVGTDDIFEKDELVERLFDYRKKEKRSRRTAENSARNGSNTEKNRKSSSSPICVPMDFHSLPAQAVASGNPDVFLRPSPGKYPSINLHVKGKNRPLVVLVDTACSGLVLRPNIVEQYNLPTFNAGVTMTAAGGNTAGTSVAKLNSATLDDGTALDELIVAGQEIGALPKKLDGIIGLSFLNQFQSVAFDFGARELILSKKMTDAYNNMEVLSKSEMKLCRIGVWSVDITLDGRGPVPMLVDTGAASTFLNWDGVRSLNMDSNHPLISRNTEALGLMGADNTALALSHRFILKRRVNLTSDPSGVRHFDPQGIDISELSSVNIDIGDLPVLDALKSEGVGGILGNDILMRCDVLHFDFGSTPGPIILSMLRK